MNTFDQKLLTTGQLNGLFIIKNIPFVCKYGRVTIPLICKITPLVSNKQNRGFTVIELIIAITIVGILATLAIPALQSFVLDNRLTSQANDLLADLSFARSEAIRRGTRVSLCKTADPTAASLSCDTATTNAWTTGRVVFVDETTTGTIDTNDRVLRVKEELVGANGSSGNRLLGDASAGGPVRISYLSTGLVENFSTGETQLRLCDSRGATYGRAIVITNTGRARVSQRGQAKSGALSCN